MKTIACQTLTQTDRQRESFRLPAFELGVQLTRVAWSAGVLALTVTLAAWALSRGAGALLGASLLAAGFISWAVAVDRHDAGSIIRAALLGTALIALALLGQFIAPEFYLLGTTMASLATLARWVRIRTPGR